MRLSSWVWAMGIGGVLALIAPGPCRAQSTNEFRTEGFRLFAAGQFRESIPLLSAVIERKPRDLEALNKRGIAFLRSNQPEAALVDFDTLIRINPRWSLEALDPLPNWNSSIGGVSANAEAWTNRGIGLVMLGRDDEAFSSFQRAIALHGFFLNRNKAGLASDYCGIGQVYHRKGDEAHALDAYGRAIQINPDDPNGFVGRGVAFAGLGMPLQAISSYDEALRIDPKHSRALSNRAVAFEQLGRDSEALKDYDATILLDPASALTHRLRGTFLSRIGRHADSLADFNAAIRLDPNNAASFKDRGGVYNRMGQYELALRDLDESIRLDPNAAKVYQNRAASYNGLGRYELAVRDCNHALSLNPKSAGALNNRGVARIALKQYEKAIDDLNDAIRISPRLVSAYVTRAEANLRIGQIEQAANDYDEVIRLDPQVAKESPTLAQIHELLKRRGQSTPDDSIALRQNLSQSSVDYAAANNKRALGDWSGAIADYTRSLRYDPNNADALAMRGWSRLCAGDPGAAEDARAALDLKGWRDPFAPYLAILGIISARQDGKGAESSHFLDEALANTHPPDWPSPIFRYLKRLIPVATLLATADDPNKLTEAHAVIGHDLLARGERTAGLEHLQWVVDHGVDGSIAKDLARQTTRRLNAQPTPATAP